MPGEWLTSLKEEESKHNTAAALRERHIRHPNGPGEKLKTPINPASKTSKTLRGNLQTPIKVPSKASKTTNGHGRGDKKPEGLERLTDKTSKTSGAEALDLIATWGMEFGYVSLHDPTTGEWHDLRSEDAPGWAVGEARRRKDLYKSGNRKAYRLTARQMEESWDAEQPPDEGIVEEHPLEEDNGSHP